MFFMVSIKELGGKITVRLVITVILLLVMIFTVQVANLEMKTGIEVKSETNSVSEGASVIEYSSLSEVQKDQFRSSIGTNFTTNNQYAFTEDFSSLNSYDYIYLDSVYYEIDTTEYRPTFHYTVGLFLVLLGLVFTISFFNLLGGLIAVVLHGSGVTEEQFVDIYERLANNGYVIVCLAGVLIIGLSIAPSLIGIQLLSAEQISSGEISESTDVISVESFSEENRDTFYSVSSGEKVYVYQFDSSNSVVKSDGEYYQLSSGHPIVFSLMFVLFGSTGFFMIVRGVGKRILADLSGKPVKDVYLFEQYA